MKTRTGNLLALALGLLVSLLLAEALARLAAPGSPPAPPAVRLDENGYRDGEHSVEKPPGVLRIAFIGDSYVFGAGVPEESRFADLVAGELQRRWPQVEIEALNLGMPGANVRDYVYALENHAIPLDPDIVVVGMVLNDFVERDAYRAYVDRREQLQHAYDARWGTLAALGRYSRIADLTNDLTRYYFSGLRELQIEYLEAAYRPGPAFSRMEEGLGTLLNEMREFRHGVVVLLPYFLENEARFDPYLRARAVIREQTESRYHEFVEVLPRLSDRPYHEWWVSRADHHPNVDAHAVIAELTVAAILRGEARIFRQPLGRPGPGEQP